MTPEELYALDGADWLAAPVGDDAQPSDRYVTDVRVSESLARFAGVPIVRHKDCPPNRVFLVNPDFMVPNPRLTVSDLA